MAATHSVVASSCCRETGKWQSTISPADVCRVRFHDSHAKHGAIDRMSCHFQSFYDSGDCGDAIRQE